MNGTMYFDASAPSTNTYHGHHQHHQQLQQQQLQQQQPHQHQHHQQHQQHQQQQQQHQSFLQPNLASNHPHGTNAHTLHRPHPGRHTIRTAGLQCDPSAGVATSSATSLSSLFTTDSSMNMGDRPQAFSASGFSKFDSLAAAQPWANTPSSLFDMPSRSLTSAASSTSLSAAAAAVATLPRSSKGPVLQTVSSMNSSLSSTLGGGLSKSQHWFGHPSAMPTFQQHHSPHAQQAPSLSTPQPQHQQQLHSQSSRLMSEHSSSMDEELIPTAIVIKNIPFAVKKEQLVQVMTELQLPLPYAFNYHFDNGVFRGLAFANFTSSEETAIVIDHLNHFELQGRKLRVEYKKMLPAAARERIEREKRERRGQLEEQHRPLPPTQLHSLPSHSSLSSHMTATSPSPVSMRHAPFECDMNDPFVLKVYSELLIFKENNSREPVQFPSHLKPEQRRTVHVLAQGLNLYHSSKGHGEQRCVVVSKRPADLGGMDGHSPISAQRDYPRTITGAASMNMLPPASAFGFSDDRGHTLKPSSGYLGANTPGGGDYPTSTFSLRSAKSYADLRSITPSPVPSTASFPASLNTFNGPQLGLGHKPLTSAGVMSSRPDDNFPSPIGILRFGSYATSRAGDSPLQSGTMPRPIGDRYGAKNISAASTPSFDSSDHRSADMSLSAMMGSNIDRAPPGFPTRQQFSSHGQENTGKEISVE